MTKEHKLPKHHYIPVFYLKQWAAIDGTVTAFRRPYRDVVATPKPPTHTGYVRGLYWLDGLDPVAANRIEDMVLSPIDNNAAIVHRMILNNQVTSLSRDARTVWSRFLVGLLLRSPATVKSIYDRMVTPGSREFRELSREFARDFPGKRYRDLPPLVMRRAALFSLAKLLHSKEVEEMISGMIWSVYDLGLPELSFFTSDRPVIMTNGLAKKDGHLAIPLSPRKLFLAFANKGIEAEIKKLSPWHIADQTNELLIRGAIELAWDMNANRLRFVADNLSANAANDRDFFGSVKGRRLSKA